MGYFTGIRDITVDRVSKLLASAYGERRHYLPLPRYAHQGDGHGHVSIDWHYKNLIDKLYMANPVVAAVENYIMQRAGEIPPHVEVMNSEGEWEAARESELYGVLQEPGVFHRSWTDFIECMTLFRNLGGEVALRLGESGNFWVMGRGQFVVKEDGAELKYWRAKKANYTLKLGGQPEPEGDQVKNGMAHDWLVNPLNRIHGLPPLLPVVLAIEAHNEGIRWNKSLIENGVRKEFWWKRKGEKLTDRQRDVKQRELDAGLKGPAHTESPWGVLDENDEIIEGTYSPKDFDWQSGLQYFHRLICVCRGIPSQLFGDPAASTFRNMEHATDHAMRAVVVPAHRRNCALITRVVRGMKLAPAQKFRVTFRDSDVPGLIDDDEKRSKIATRAVACTIGELRKLQGKKPLGDDRDKLVLVPAGYQTPEQIAAGVGDATKALDMAAYFKMFA